MKKKLLEFKPGTITLYDKGTDTEFGGSLSFTNQEEPINKNESTHDLRVGVSSCLQTSSAKRKPSTLQSGFSGDKDLEEENNKEMFLREVDTHLATINNGTSKVDHNLSMQEADEPISRNIFKEYLGLIDFALLFRFLWSELKLVLEKLFYSEDVTQVKTSFKLPASSLAIVFLLISLLSLSSILLPLAVGKINAVNQQAKAEEIEKTNQKLAEERAAQLKIYEIDPSKEQEISKDFKLFIPKIGLDSDISPSVNLDSEEDYKRQLLTTGVAHAKGSYFPGQKGSVFLFAHSTDTVFNIARFNAKFFSLGELQTGDEIQVAYQGKDYKYSVVDRQIIEPNQVDLIRNSGNALILMTCTPPGTDWQRLVIFAKEQQTQST